MGWVTGTVQERKQWTDRLFSLRIDADVEPFVAGQFNRLRMEIDGELVGRPYSYVNAPDERPLDFYMITVPDGPLSNRLVQLEPGDTVELMPRATGFFTLNEIPDGRDLWLLSTGTGIGPFLSILKTDEPWERFENIRLVHAVRHAEELTYQDTIARFSERDPERFQYIPFVSREAHPGAIQGRITTALSEGELEAQAGIDFAPEHSQVMLCGNPDMVSETQSMLRERGLEKNRRRKPGHLTTESYW
ncbi:MULTISPECIES: ferredoxin--NADP reductase [Thioalkalivibrio]|uniref:ferredoxin--NADP(+) reductase n=1 Tax=Thioalkalivibrio halophilus TaxID=252474 RepID=A0A1V2ZYL0_9GAMM|nr:MULTISPECIES: ferredoxin--NADP reductase [Thioalkalivibrio]OOC10176.1 ferredoxin--NADP(+) reductase [Thioalkalivibrio halophilus]PYG00341.1 ferredoxin--NADP+ reductase [Thioalkalivibrio sp. ALE21]